MESWGRLGNRAWYVPIKNKTLHTDQKHREAWKHNTKHFFKPICLLEASHLQKITTEQKHNTET